MKRGAIISLAAALVLAACSRDQRSGLAGVPGGSVPAGAQVVTTAEHEVKVAVDANHDGRLDLVKIYRDGHLVRVEQDRNADGRVDLVREYRENQLSREIRDDNFDGKPETVSTYRHGKLAIVEHDPDGCGWADRTDYYDDNGRLTRSETRAPDTAER